MPDYAAAIAAKVASGEWVEVRKGVFEHPKPAPAPPPPVPVGPAMQGDMPAPRAVVDKRVVERYKRFGLKYTPPATFKPRGCSGKIGRAHV